MDTPNQNPAPNQAPIPEPAPQPKQQLPQGQTNIMALISYIGPLCLIPFFTKPNDEFVRFHMKQGLVLFGAEIVVFVITLVIPPLLILGNVAGIVWLIFSIIGIVNVVNNKLAELPLIGSLAGKIKV